MALRSLTLLCLALPVVVSAAAVSACAEEECALQDATALYQEVVEVNQADIPSVDSILDKAKDAVSKVKTASGSALDKAAGRLTTAMKAVADGIKLLLDKIDDKAKEMSASNTRIKTELLKAAATDLNAFAAELRAYFAVTASTMEEVMTEVSNTDQGIRRALEMADQTDLANTVHATMKEAISLIDEFRSTLVMARAEDWPSLAADQMQNRLEAVGNDLDAGLAKAEAFAQPWLDSLKALADGIDAYAAKLLPEANTMEVKEAFNRVERKTQEVVDDILAADREAVSGYKAAKNTFIPAQKVQQSGGARYGLGIFAAMMCVAAARV